MRIKRLILATISLTLCSQFLTGPSAVFAHNAKVHEGMTTRAHKIMMVVTRAHNQGLTVGPPPTGATMAQWKAFHADVAAALDKLDQLAQDPAKTSHKLSTAASAPD